MKDRLSEVNGPRRILSLFDAICIIVGTIIGAGIFQTAPEIAKMAGSFPALTGLWLFGGFLTVVGALCFAELTTNNQNLLGGDYGFLKRAFGRAIGFMFAWATFWITRPANIGVMALTFALYFDEVLPWESSSHQIRQLVYAVAAVVLLSAVNLIGLNQGRWIQNVLTSTKVFGLLAIVCLAFFVAPEKIIESDAAESTNTEVVVGESVDTAAEVSTDESPRGQWLLAIVFIMFSFGGWNDLSFVANEIKNPEQNLFRSLIYGAVAVTAIYLIVNIAFVVALGYAEMSGSKAVATDVVRATLGADSLIGRKGTQIIAALICISCLGAINGIIITSPRIYFAAGRDFELIKGLGNWDQRRNQPWLATALQALVTIGLFSLCFQDENPFKVILVVSAPFFWLFLGLVGVSLIVLRRKTGSNEAGSSGYRVPLYPLPPIILATACFSMVYSSVNYVIFKQYWTTALVVMALMIIGICLGLVLKPTERKAAELQNQ